MNVFEAQNGGVLPDLDDVYSPSSDLHCLLLDSASTPNTVTSLQPDGCKLSTITQQNSAHLPVPKMGEMIPPSECSSLDAFILSVDPTQPLYNPIHAEDATKSTPAQSLDGNLFDMYGNSKYDPMWVPSVDNDTSFLDHDPDLQRLAELCGGFSVTSPAFDINTIDPSLLQAEAANIGLQEECALLQPIVEQNILMSEPSQSSNRTSARPSLLHRRTDSKRSHDEFDDEIEDDRESEHSEYQGSDADSSSDEYGNGKASSGRKAKKKRLSSTSRGRKTHSRGSSSSSSGTENKVVHFVAPKYMPGPLIKNWAPQPYTGPAAEAVGNITVTNTYNGLVSYTTYKPLPDQGKFCRDERGWLQRDVLFTVEDMVTFIRTHPLGKNLLFRLEKRCVYSGTRYTDSHQTNCRSKCCLVAGCKRTIREGQFRIAIEEVWGRIPRREKFNNDPFFCAGYFHVECFEHLVDVGQLIRLAMLRSFPRIELPKEPRTSKTEPNRLCLSEKIDNCFKRFCKRLNDDPAWQGYNTNVVEKLSTQLWLTNVRKGKTSLGVKPAQLSQDIAKHLIATKGPDPGWGGSRFTGIRVAQAEAVLTLGQKEKLKGSAHNVREANQQAYEEVLAQAKLDDFSDGEEWEQVVFGINVRAPFHARMRAAKKQKKPMPQPGTPGYMFPVNKDRLTTPSSGTAESQIHFEGLEDLFGGELNLA